MLDLSLSLASAALFHGSSAGISDASFANVVFLSGFEGANNGTTAVDEGPAGRSVTLGGAAVTSTALKKFGDSSLLLSGTAGDGAICADHADWALAGGAFTVEGWFNWSSAAAVGRTLVGQWLTTGNMRNWRLQWSNTSQLLFQNSPLGSDTQTHLLYAFVPTPGQWYHIAVDCNATACRMYVDGAMVATNAPLALTDVTARFIVGATDTATSTGSPFLGNIDEVRITKGVARYASASGFTPPATAFPRN